MHEAERSVARDNYDSFDRRLRAVEAAAPAAAPASAEALAAGPAAAQCAPTEKRLDELQVVVFGLSARAAAIDGRVLENDKNLKNEIEALRNHLDTSTAGQAQHNRRLDIEIADLDLKNVGLQLAVDDAITAVQSVNMSAGQHDARILATEQLLYRMQNTVQQHEEAQRAAAGDAWTSQPGQSNTPTLQASQATADAPYAQAPAAQNDAWTAYRACMFNNFGVMPHGPAQPAPAAQHTAPWAPPPGLPHQHGGPPNLPNNNGPPGGPPGQPGPNGPPGGPPGPPGPRGAPAWGPASQQGPRVDAYTKLFDSKVASDKDNKFDGVNGGHTWYRKTRNYMIGQAPDCAHLLDLAELAPQLIDHNS